MNTNEEKAVAKEQTTTEVKTRYTHTLLFDGDVNKVRVALLDQQRKLMLADEQSGESVWCKGDIYVGTITSIVPEINVVFVLYNNGKKHGFLAFDHIAPEYYLKPWNAEEDGEPDLNHLLKVGQKIMVQVKKDQSSHDSKGDALTTYISLAGTYLVFLPNSTKHAVSRKADAEQKQKISDMIEQLNIPKESGVIMRSAALSQVDENNIDEIRYDYNGLVKQWQHIRSRYEEINTPTLLHEEENIIIRNIRDHVTQKIDKIITNDAASYTFIEEYLKHTRPMLLERNVLEMYNHEQPLFEHFGVETQIEDIFQTHHDLRSGGQLVIQGTEAGITIDVNSRRSKAKNYDDTVLQTNVEAAEKAADLLRLRDMGGIILIDFIEMKVEKHRAMVVKAFDQARACDKATFRFKTIDEDSGCLLVLRQSMGYPFFKSSLEPIEGDQSIVFGKRRSVASYARHILHVIENAAQYESNIIKVQLPTDVATYITNEGRNQLIAIENKYQTQVYIIPNESFKTLKYILKRFNDETITPSHHDIVNNEHEKSWRGASRAQAGISQKDLERVRSMEYSPQTNQKKIGILGSLWSIVFGDESGKHKEASTIAHTEETMRGNKGHKKPQQRRRHNGPSNRRNQTGHDDGRRSHQNRNHNKPDFDPSNAEGQPQSPHISNNGEFSGTSVNRRRGQRRYQKNNRHEGKPQSSGLNKDSDLMKMDDDF